MTKGEQVDAELSRFRDPHLFMIDKSGDLQWWRDGDTEQEVALNWISGPTPFVAIVAIRCTGDYAHEPELWIRGADGSRYSLWWVPGNFIKTVTLTLEHTGARISPSPHGWPWRPAA